MVSASLILLRLNYLIGRLTIPLTASTVCFQLHGHIQAEDADIGPNADIMYSLSGSGHELFDIDAANGSVSVSPYANASALDREQTDAYILQVRIL